MILEGNGFDFLFFFFDINLLKDSLVLEEPNSESVEEEKSSIKITSSWRGRKVKEATSKREGHIIPQPKWKEFVEEDKK